MNVHLRTDVKCRRRLFSKFGNGHCFILTVWYPFYFFYEQISVYFALFVVQRERERARASVLIIIRLQFYH